MGTTGHAETRLVAAAVFAHDTCEHHDPPVERFTQPEIIFTLEDRWSIRTPRGRAEVHSGLVLLANPQEEYRCWHFDRVPRDRTLAVAFPGLAQPAAGPLAEWLDQQGQMPFGPLAVPLTPELLRYRQALLAEVCGRTPGYRLKLEMLAGAMLVDVVRMLGCGMPGGPWDRSSREALEQARMFMDEHFTEDLTLATLSKVAAISPFHFSRLFKEATGQSPHQYLLRKRLSHAAFLLKETNLPVTEIALMVGFGDLTNFARAFRRFTGAPPTVFRSGTGPTGWYGPQD